VSAVRTSCAKTGSVPAAPRGTAFRTVLRAALRACRRNGLRRCLVLARAIPSPSAPNTPCHDHAEFKTIRERVGAMCTVFQITAQFIAQVVAQVVAQVIARARPYA